jgi:hypothetical protein
MTLKPIACLVERFRQMHYARIEWPTASDELHKYKQPAHTQRANYMLKLHERADWAGTDPELKEFARKFLNALRRNDVPMYVHTAYRTPSLQAALKAKGLSQLLSGPHQRGAALDIVHAHYHWNCSNQFWDYIGAVGKQVIKANRYNIEWGGDWNFYDPAHWQLKNWRDKPVVDQHSPTVRRSPFSQNNTEFKYDAQNDPIS